MDSWGKWGYVNSYFIMIQMVAFKYELNKGEFAAIAVTPQLIYYLYIIATMLNSILTHFMIHEHRKSVELHHDEKAILI